MTTTPNVVVPLILKELFAAGAVNSARVEIGDKGFVVIFRIGMTDRVLGVGRKVHGGPRYFLSLDGAASVLQSYGVTEFAVNTRNWVPRAVSRGLRPIVEADLEEIEMPQERAKQAA